MAFLLTQGGRTDYNYREIFVDSFSEIADIDKDKCCPGSIVYIIPTGEVYMLSNAGNWEVQ